MKISKANARILGATFAEAIHSCANPEQRHGVLKARDLTADLLHAQSTALYYALLGAFASRLDELEPRQPIKLRGFDKVAA
jgi:hypothetical protein